MLILKFPLLVFQDLVKSDDDDDDDNDVYHKNVNVSYACLAGPGEER